VLKTKTKLQLLQISNYKCGWERNWGNPDKTKWQCKYYVLVFSEIKGRIRYFANQSTFNAWFSIYVMLKNVKSVRMVLLSLIVVDILGWLWL